MRNFREIVKEVIVQENETCESLATHKKMSPHKSFNHYGGCGGREPLLRTTQLCSNFSNVYLKFIALNYACLMIIIDMFKSTLKETL